MFITQNACKSSDGVRVKVCKMTQVTSSPDTGPQSSLIHLRSSLSPGQGLLTRDGGIHHLAEVVNDVGFMLDVTRKEWLICLLCPCYPKTKPLIGHQKCYSVAIHYPQVHRGFNQPSMLGLVSWVCLGNTCRGLSINR